MILKITLTWLLVLLAGAMSLEVAERRGSETGNYKAYNMISNGLAISVAFTVIGALILIWRCL